MCHFLDYSVKFNRFVVNILFYELPRRSFWGWGQMITYLRFPFVNPLFLLHRERRCVFTAATFLRLHLQRLCVRACACVSSPNWEFVFIKSREWTLRCKSTPVVYVSSVSVGGGSRLTVANHPLSSIINNHNHIMNLQLSPKLRAPGARSESVFQSWNNEQIFFFNILTCFPP